MTAPNMNAESVFCGQDVSALPLLRRCFSLSYRCRFPEPENLDEYQVQSPRDDAFRRLQALAIKLCKMTLAGLGDDPLLLRLYVSLLP